MSPSRHQLLDDALDMAGAELLGCLGELLADRKGNPGGDIGAGAVDHLVSLANRGAGRDHVIDDQHAVAGGGDFGQDVGGLVQQVLLARQGIGRVLGGLRLRPRQRRNRRPLRRRTRSVRMARQL